MPRVSKASSKQTVMNIPKSYSLIKEIKANKFYKKTGKAVDPIARQRIDESCKGRQIARGARAGQLILFHYNEPKTEEELEYYDASPCTIFFGTYKAKEGKRILGFNIHYYPREARFNIMDKIFQMYRPVYAKYFKSGIDKDLDAFDYHYLIDQLNNYGLGFGVRMYIPELASAPKIIPPEMWTTAVYTEGWFRKKTKAAIMQYWRHWIQSGGHVKRHKPTKKQKIAKIRKSTNSSHRKVLQSNQE